MSHDEFWDLAPKEAYLSIKAHKARLDAHYSQIASFTSVLTNVSGNLKKKDQIKGEDLYTPQLTGSGENKKPTDESPREKAKRIAAQNKAVADEMERFAALAPPIEPR